MSEPAAPGTNPAKGLFVYSLVLLAIALCLAGVGYMEVLAATGFAAIRVFIGFYFPVMGLLFLSWSLALLAVWRYSLALSVLLIDTALLGMCCVSGW